MNGLGRGLRAQWSMCSLPLFLHLSVTFNWQCSPPSPLPGIESYTAIQLCLYSWLSPHPAFSLPPPWCCHGGVYTVSPAHVCPTDNCLSSTYCLLGPPRSFCATYTLLCTFVSHCLSGSPLPSRVWTVYLCCPISTCLSDCSLSLPLGHRSSSLHC